MRVNKTKAKLGANQIAVGAVIQIPSPDLVELMEGYHEDH